MASFANYFILFTIICQISNLAFCAEERFPDDSVTILGFGNSSSTQVSPIYHTNVNLLLWDFSSQSARSSFNNTSYGDAFGFYLCRGDLSADDCNDCIDDVREFFLGRVGGFSNDAILLNMRLKCMVHYANNSRSLEYRSNNSLSTNGFGGGMSQQYNTTLFSTMEELAREAGNGNLSRANFGTRVVQVPGSQESIYILVQCTPDISATNCSSCLSDLYSTFPPSSIAGDILGYNCLLKYNNEDFFGVSSSAYRGFMPSYYFMILVLILSMYVTFM